MIYWNIVFFDISYIGIVSFYDISEIFQYSTYRISRYVIYVRGEGPLALGPCWNMRLPRRMATWVPVVPDLFLFQGIIYRMSKLSIYDISELFRCMIHRNRFDIWYIGIVGIFGKSELFRYMICRNCFDICHRYIEPIGVYEVPGTWVCAALSIEQ